jgi:hypothetical protein
MKHYYNYYNKTKYIKKNIIDDSNINYYENYEDLTNKYITKYRNKTFYEDLLLIPCTSYPLSKRNFAIYEPS